MQILEKCMEDMKAVYKLNEQKLDFNLRVLEEREKVNTATKISLKNKVNRYLTNRITIRTRLGDQIKYFKEKNIKLTTAYKRITEQFKELQEKFRRFESSDDK